MNILRLLGIAVVSLILSGCAQQMPPLNFSVPNVGVSEKKIDAEMKSLIVTVARPDEKTGNLPAGVEVDIPRFMEKSLTEALNKMAIFQDDSSRKVNVSAKILKFDIPSFGASMTTNTTIRYEISDRKTGDIIFTQDISSSGVTPMDYAFVGLIRVRESINRAAQNSITLFLQALETVDVKKPMFPVKMSAAK